jgi:nucleotide-binding universal stress UspA family protein
MIYKSILTILTEPGEASRVLPPIAQFCQGFNAHLQVLCLGINRAVTDGHYMGAHPGIDASAVEAATHQSHDIAEAARAQLSGLALAWEVDELTSLYNAVGSASVSPARFSDLVILPKPYGQGRGLERESILDSVLQTARAPVLVMPRGCEGKLPERIIIGWNQSDEALRATRAALPLLQAAQNVHITIINPGPNAPNEAAPGTALATFLSRHDVHADIDLIPQYLPHTSETLSRHANDKNADMIVMGAYGHSAIREALLGSTTKRMLSETLLPILLAH